MLHIWCWRIHKKPFGGFHDFLVCCEVTTVCGVLEALPGESIALDFLIAVSWWKMHTHPQCTVLVQDWIHAIQNKTTVHFWQSSSNPRQIPLRPETTRWFNSWPVYPRTLEVTNKMSPVELPAAEALKLTDGELSQTLQEVQKTKKLNELTTWIGQLVLLVVVVAFWLWSLFVGCGGVVCWLWWCCLLVVVVSFVGCGGVVCWLWLLFVGCGGVVCWLWWCCLLVVVVLFVGCGGVVCWLWWW